MTRNRPSCHCCNTTPRPVSPRTTTKRPRAFNWLPARPRKPSTKPRSASGKSSPRIVERRSVLQRFVAQCRSGQFSLVTNVNSLTNDDTGYLQKIQVIYNLAYCVLFVSRMPLAEATALEVLRLKTFVPVVDHATLCDTEVGGYFVPRGTTVSRCHLHRIACRYDYNISIY